MSVVEQLEHTGIVDAVHVHTGTVLICDTSNTSVGDIVTQVSVTHIVIAVTAPTINHLCGTAEVGHRTILTLPIAMVSQLLAFGGRVRVCIGQAPVAHVLSRNELGAHLTFALHAVIARD